MDPEIIAVFIPIVALTIPVVAIITSHQRKMAEIKARMTQGLSSEIRDHLNEIKNEITHLRETTTKFDLSFDAAVTRLEERVDRVEQRQSSGIPLTESTNQVVGQGRGG